LKAKQFHHGHPSASLGSAERASLDLTGKARRIAIAILAYLVEHPDAKDSLAGIRLWWIDDPDSCSDKELRWAAQALVERGLLRTWEASPGSVVFGLSPKFLEAPEALLGELESRRVNDKP
jgi:hypothetical protein